jgi:hypothetical protein
MLLSFDSISAQGLSERTVLAVLYERVLEYCYDISKTANVCISVTSKRAELLWSEKCNWITYSERVSVALVIRRKKRMRPFYFNL